jgi:hypothetical protein
LEAVSGEKLRSVFFMTPQDREVNATFQEIFDGATELRTTGNGFYKSDDFQNAIKR